MQRRPLLLSLLGGVSELAGAADPPLKAAP